MYTIDISFEDLNESKLALMNKFLLEEFKNDRGYSSLIYYPLFLIRRLFYSATQIFLIKYPIAQAYLNVFFSLLMCFYVIIYRPYKEKMINFVQISGEICVLAVFAASSLFLFSVSENIDKYIEDFCIYTVYANISINIFVSFYYFAKALVQLYKKLEKARTEQFIESAYKNFGIN